MYSFLFKVTLVDDFEFFNVISLLMYFTDCLKLLSPEVKSEEQTAALLNSASA